MFQRCCLVLSCVVLLEHAALPIARGQAIVAPADAAQVAASPLLVIDPQGLAGEEVASVDISSDGQLVAAAAGKDVRIWSIEDQQLYATLRGYSAPHGYKIGNIHEVRFIPGTHQLVVAISDNTREGSTRVYDLAQPDRITQLVEGHRGCTINLAVSPSGKYMATWGCDFNFWVYHRPAGDSLWTKLYDANLLDSLDATTPGDADHSSPVFNKLESFGFPEEDQWFLQKSSMWFKIVEADSDLINVEERRGVTDFRQWPEALHAAVHRMQNVRFRPGTAAEDISLTDLKARDHAWLAVAGSTSHGSGASSHTSYWASTWAADVPEPQAVYRDHRYHLSALSLRQVEGPSGRQSLAASGDRLGEVHVWNAETGERMARFGPRNTQFYGIAWGDDDATVHVSATPYPTGVYDYNHFGRLTHSFNLRSRQYRVLPRTAESTGSSVGRTWVAGPQGELELSIRRRNADSTLYDVCGVDREGTAVSLNPNAHRGLGDVLPYSAWIDEANVGSPYCFTALSSSDGAPSRRFVVGYTTGAVEEYELIAPLPDKPPVMACRRKFIGHSATVTGIAISPDGRRMATCAWDGTIRLWSLNPTPPNGDVDYSPYGSSVAVVRRGSESERAGLQDADVMVTFDGRPFYERTRHMTQGVYKPGDVVDITFERNDLGREPTKHEFARGEFSTWTIQSTIVLTEAPSYVEPYLSVFVSNTDEWVAYTPSGFYDASPQGEPFIGWHINRQRHEPALFYGVDQFRKQLYRPDIIDAVLESRNEAKAVERANSPLPGAPEIYPEVVSAPTVEFLSPSSPHQLDATHVDVELLTTSSANDPGRLEIAVDGRPAARAPAIVSDQTRDGRIETRYRHQVDVGPGRNLVTARIVGRGSSSSLARLIVENSREDSGAKPNLRILAIGISNYANADLNLLYADRDARDFAAAWQAQQGKMYASVETRVLVNEEATVKNIRSGLGWLATALASPYDVSYLFIAGHGLFSPNGLWHFGGHELNLEELKATAISQSELSDLLDYEIHCRTVLFADTCHAAGFRETANARRRHPQGIELWRTLRGMSLVSCLGWQDSVESDEWQNGAFTEALLTALDSPAADIDANGLLSFDELQLFVKRETKRLAESAAGVEQTPAAEMPLTVSEVMLAWSRENK